jgi:histidyl-tRNA synthetase
MSKQLAQNVKGTRDFLPAEAAKRKWLRDRIVSIFEQWGYDPMETPTMEPLEIFEGQVGEDEKLFFKFQDPGGRDVALRYDQTVPTCRVIGQYFSELVFPLRRYQIQNAFRAEKPQRGRYREFLQCDADIFGISSPLADAEVIALSLQVYKSLGFEQAVVLINDRELLQNIPYTAIVAIDKLKKIGEDGVIDEMVTKGIDREKAVEYFAYVRNLKPNQSVSTILDFLRKMGFDESWYRFEPTLARSFSYSTGPIWEVEIPGFTAGSVLGGERYDKLVEDISGRAVSATGFAVGFDRTLEAAEQFGLLPHIATNSKVLVTVFAESLLDESIKVLRVLRDAGVSAELYPDPTVKLEKQLRFADQKGISYAVIVGENEVSQGKVVLKDLKARSQESLGIEAIVNRLV